MVAQFNINFFSSSDNVAIGYNKVIAAPVLNYNSAAEPLTLEISRSVIFFEGILKKIVPG